MPAAAPSAESLPGDLAAAAHDHERHEVGQADQRVGARVAGRRDELHGASAGTPLAGERGRDHVLDEGLRAAQRGRARAQDGRAAGLEHLRGDVDRDVGPGLEHRADHADGHAALVHPLPVGRSRTNACSGGSGVAARTSSWVAMSARRSGVRRRRSSRPCGHAARLGGLDVGGVGGEQRLGPLAQEPGGGAQRGVDRRATRGPDARRGRGGAHGGRADGGLLGVVCVSTTAELTGSACHAGRTGPTPRPSPTRQRRRLPPGAAAPMRSTAICDERHPAAATGDETGLT